MRVELVQLEEKKYVVLFDMHHIISDGVSMNIFAKDLWTSTGGLSWNRSASSIRM